MKSREATPKGQNEMANIRKLIEQRAAKVAELRTLSDKGAALSDEERARFDTVKAEADALQAQIERQATVDDLERRASATPLNGTGDGRLDDALRSFSLVRAIASRAGLDVDASREMELSQELARRSGRAFQGIAVPMAIFHQPIEQRTVTTATPAGAPGGNIIATDYRGDQFIDLLRRALVIRRLGARVLTDLRGNVDVPRKAFGATAFWVAENQPLTYSDIGFEAVALSPKHCGAVTEVSRNMLQQASPDIEQLVRADFAALLAGALDAAALAGDPGATPAMPRGILNTTGIGNVAVGANGGPLTYDLVADLQGAVADVNAEDGSLSFLTNTKVRRAAAKLKDTAGNPLGVGAVFQGQPVAFTNHVPANATKGTGTNLSALVYGNFADLVLALWSEFDVLVNPYEQAAYLRGNVAVRGMMTVDVGVRQPASFAAIKDIAA